MSKIINFRLQNDPVEYKLSYDFNVVCDVEEETGCNLLQTLTGSALNSKLTRGFLYACLKPNHPLVELKEAGDLLTREMSTVLAALGEVMVDARAEGQADSDTDSDADSAAPQPSTATSSPELNPAHD